MIEWKDAKEVLPSSDRSCIFLGSDGELYAGYYCKSEDGFFYSLEREDYQAKDVTHWDYFEYPL